MSLRYLEERGLQCVRVITSDKCLGPVAARLRHIAGTKWGTRRYLDMDRLDEPEEAGEALT